jgi:hypothetical protein
VDSFDNLDDYIELSRLSRQGSAGAQRAASAAMRRLMAKHSPLECPEFSFAGSESPLVNEETFESAPVSAMTACHALEAIVAAKYVPGLAAIVPLILGDSREPERPDRRFSVRARNVNALNMIVGTSFGAGDTDGISGWWREHQGDIESRLIEDAVLWARKDALLAFQRLGPFASGVTSLKSRVRSRLNRWR